MMSLLGSGRAVARWVNLDKRQVLMMFTFAVVVRRMVDHWKISNRTALMALVQFESKWLRSPVRVMPNSLKGAGSIVNPVVGVIWGSSGAFPKRAYLVLETLVARPDSFLKSSSTRRMWFTCLVGWKIWSNILFNFNRFFRQKKSEN